MKKQVYKADKSGKKYICIGKKINRKIPNFLPKAGNILLYKARNLSTFRIHTVAGLHTQIHLTTSLGAEIKPWKSPYLTTLISMLHGHEAPGRGFSL